MALPIRQIAYFVPDVRVAAARHAALFGSGPYFVAEHIPLRKALYRGREGRRDHRSAYGQWGELMVECVQQNNPGPSAFHAIERYSPTDVPTAFYAFVTAAADGFDGTDPVRDIRFD